MQISDAIRARRTVKRYTAREITRPEIEMLLDAAALGPNHRLTQPWRFYVLGPEARHAYGLALGNRKAKKIDDPAKAAETRDAVAAEHRALPAMLAIAIVKDENPEVAEENYAAALMGVQNLILTAVGLGLGTALKTGAIMDDPAARSAAGVGDNERIVVIVNVGEPAEIPAAKARQAASAFTTWRD